MECWHGSHHAPRDAWPVTHHAERDDYFEVLPADGWSGWAHRGLGAPSRSNIVHPAPFRRVPKSHRIRNTVTTGVPPRQGIYPGIDPDLETVDLGGFRPAAKGAADLKGFIAVSPRRLPDLGSQDRLHRRPDHGLGHHRSAPEHHARVRPGHETDHPRRSSARIARPRLHPTCVADIVIARDARTP